LFLFIINEEFIATQCVVPILYLESVPYLCSSFVLAIWLISDEVSNILGFELIEFLHHLQCQLSGGGGFYYTLRTFFTFYVVVKEEMYFELIRWLLLSNHVEVKLRIILVIQPEVGIRICYPFSILILSIVVVSITISVLVPFIVVSGCTISVVRTITPAFILLPIFI